MVAKTSVNMIAKALFTINRHAKTAPQPQHLYTIKKLAIQKLLEEKKAEKVGLHFSKNPKFSNQYSTVLVRINNYSFHVLPSKEDLKSLKHLGHINEDHRNPQVKMALSYAKKIVYEYIDWQGDRKATMPQQHSAHYTPLTIGKINNTSHHHKYSPRSHSFKRSFK